MKREKAKFNRVIDAMCDGDPSRKGRATAQLEELWYGIPQPWPEHGGGTAAQAINPSVLEFMRAMWLDGERVQVAIIEATCKAIKEAATTAGCSVPKGLSASSLRRKYMPLVRGDNRRKRKRREWKLLLCDTPSTWERLGLSIPKKVSNRKP